MKHETQESEVRAMTPQEIKGHLLIKGYRVTDVAAELKVSVGAVSQAINDNPCFSWRIRKWIAEKIGKPVEAIWPSSVAA